MRIAICRSARSSIYTWHTPSRCLIMGMRDSFITRSIKPLPPRGTMMSTYWFIVSSSPTPARSAGATPWLAGRGGDVGARLVDDADPAQGHAHAPDADAAGALAQLGDGAHRIGEARDLLPAPGPG